MSIDNREAMANSKGAHRAEECRGSEMTTTDEARVTDEQIANHVDGARRMLALVGDPNYIGGWRDIVIVALADRLAAREAERSEMVALLEAINVDGYRDGLSEWDERRRTILAKLRGTPMSNDDWTEQPDGMPTDYHAARRNPAPSAPPERPGEQPRDYFDDNSLAAAMRPAMDPPADVAGPNKETP